MPGFLSHVPFAIVSHGKLEMGALERRMRITRVEESEARRLQEAHDPSKQGSTNPLALPTMAGHGMFANRSSDHSLTLGFRLCERA